MSDNEDTQPRTEAPPVASKPPSSASTPAKGETATTTSTLRRRGSSGDIHQNKSTSSSSTKPRKKPSQSAAAAAAAAAAADSSASILVGGFVPSASFFTDTSNKSRDEMMKTMTAAATPPPSSSTSAEQNHTPSAAAAATPTTPRGSALRSEQCRSSPYRSQQQQRPSATTSTTASHVRDDDGNYDDDNFSLHFTPGSNRKHHAPRSISPLQRSLDALRRKQAVRMALEEGVSDDGDDVHNADSPASPDYWAPSPVRGLNSQPMIAPNIVSPSTAFLRQRQRQQQRPTSDEDDEGEQTAAVGSRRRRNAAAAAASASSPSRSLLQRLSAFTSTQDFGEELVITVVSTVFRSLMAALWTLLTKIATWLYRVVYYILFDAVLAGPDGNKKPVTSDGERLAAEAAAKSKNVHEPGAGGGYPSPFPGFYRDAFFSTWSPHELLEPTDLPMTSAFAPTPLPRHLVDSTQRNSGATAAEMLRPTPAPPFWWLSLMEISGRHFIDTNWACALSSMVAQATVEARRFWWVHEDEVLRGQDLVRRVVAGGDGVLNSSSSSARRSVGALPSPPPPLVAAASMSMASPASPISEWSRSHQMDNTPRAAAFHDMLRSV